MMILSLACFLTNSLILFSTYIPPMPTSSNTIQLYLLWSNASILSPFSIGMAKNLLLVVASVWVFCSSWFGWAHKQHVIAQIPHILAYVALTRTGVFSCYDYWILLHYLLGNRLSIPFILYHYPFVLVGRYFHPARWVSFRNRRLGLQTAYLSQLSSHRCPLRSLSSFLAFFKPAVFIRNAPVLT